MQEEIRIDPDKKYEEFLSDNRKYKLRVEFLKEEAKSFIKLKALIDNCSNGKSFNENLNEMIALCNNIRSISLNILYDKYKIYQIKKRSYIRKLREKIQR